MGIGAAFTRWEHRYGIVLLLILCSLVFQLAASDEDWARVVTIALQGGTLVLALCASQARRLIERLATVVVALAVLGSTAALISTWIARAREAGAQLVVFPEQVVTGYPAEDLWLKSHFLDAASEAVDE